VVPNFFISAAEKGGKCLILSLRRTFFKGGKCLTPPFLKVEKVEKGGIRD